MQNGFGRFFHYGYVTLDLDAAVARFQDRFGKTEFLIFEPGIVNGQQAPSRRIGLTFIDDVMTEIIEPEPKMDTIYGAPPPISGAMALHHLGFYIDDHEAKLAELIRLGYDAPMHGKLDGQLAYSFADTRADLGHYCEFIQLYEGGKAFYDQVPRLRTR